MPTAMEDLVRRMEEYAARNGIAYGAGDAPEAVEPEQPVNMTAPKPEDLAAANQKMYDQNREAYESLSGTKKVRAQQAVEAIAAAVEEAEMDPEQWLAFEGEDEDGDPIEMTTAEEAEKAADPFSR